MNILYDGQMLRWQCIGGISRYFSEVIARLPKEWVPSVIGLSTRGHALLRHHNLRTSSVRGIRPMALRRQWWKVRYGRGAHVLHPTSYGLTAGLSYDDFKCPIVITVHDLIQVRYATMLDETGATAQGLREAMRRADHVICVSKATETDLLEIHPEMTGKTSVVHHGNSFEVGSPRTASFSESAAFLFVGARGGYKNYQFLLRAFAKACNSCPSMRLQVVGLAPTPEERWQSYFLGISDRVDYFVLPDDDVLRELYAKAVALLYPSCHEGFGIPALEAMACGTIVVTANTTSLPEVVGDAGIMLDPRDEDSWTDCILELANGGGDRARLLEKSRKRVSQFSWDRAAQRHIEIYERLGAS